jgi:hypothetical protein
MAFLQKNIKKQIEKLLFSICLFFANARHGARTDMHITFYKVSPATPASFLKRPLNNIAVECIG